MPRLILAACLLGLLCLALGAVPAQAATPAPGWTLDDFATPTNFTPADNGDCLSTLNDSIPSCDAYLLTARNAGSQPTDGSSATLTDSLPSGLTVQRIAFFWHGPGATAAGLDKFDFGSFLCDPAAVQCLSPFTLEPDDSLEMIVYVTVDDPNASGPLDNSPTISGGGAPDATASTQNQISSSVPAFGAAGFSSYVAGSDGRPDTQAGGHPYELTTRIDLANLFRTDVDAFRTDVSVEDFRDAIVDLPLGFVGSALAAPQCTFAQLSAASQQGQSDCPDGSVVGHIRTEPATLAQADSSIYNMVHEHGVAAEFGYVDLGGASHVLYARVVPGPGGYVLQVTAPQAPQIPLSDIVTTFYGDPTAKNGTGNGSALFTNPSICNGQPLTTSVHLDSWNHPGAPNPDGTPDLSDPHWASTSTTSPPVTGCNQLQFHPRLSVQPDSTSADSPSGLDVGLTVAQSQNRATLGTPPLKRAVVTLPPGLVVNPSAADGLQACSPAQIDLGSAAPPSCPDASKVGTVQLETPLLPGTLTGSIYLATQFDNPFHSLLAGYIVVDDPTTGVVIKIPGNLAPDPASGQISGVFDDNPQFPFSDLRLHFFGGARGELTTPPTCGGYQTTSQLTPWSAPDSGPPATPSDTFTTTTGPGGGSCPPASTFAPSLTAGTATPIAGRYSPFVFKLARENGSQRISAIDTTLPEGLLGRLAGVPYCTDSQIAAAAARSNPGEGALERARPSCPAASEVGTVTVGAGSGAPFYVQGHAYLAGPYKGAPLSLAIVTPAVAGPFDLGSVVVRTALYVNETTVQIHAVSDPIPQILQGVPLDLRSIVLNLDKPSFTLNPTSCDPKQIVGAATSTLGNVAPLAERFQVGACNALAFKPKLSLALKGATHRGAHPALRAVLRMPANGQANIARAQVTLPHAEFLDQGHIRTVCTRVQFKEGAGNGANCPAASVYGFAKAITPILSEPLQGPVYLRSSEHKLPDLVAALHNAQVDIALDGRIDSVNGQIRNTFETVPDAPVTSFTLEMQGGRKGLLINSTNLCQGTHRATVDFTAHNGKLDDFRPVLKAKCGKGRKKGHGKRHRRRR